MLIEYSNFLSNKYNNKITEMRFKDFVFKLVSVIYWNLSKCITIILFKCYDTFIVL